MEFNADGSLKLPAGLVKKPRRISIRKDVVSEYAPKRCMLSITGEKGRIQTVLSMFSCETPIKKIEHDRGFDIEIGSDFRRCSDCRSLCFRLSSSVNGDCSIDQGTCASRVSQQQFCEEDYFS